MLRRIAVLIAIASGVGIAGACTPANFTFASGKLGAGGQAGTGGADVGGGDSLASSTAASSTSTVASGSGGMATSSSTGMFMCTDATQCPGSDKSCATCTNGVCGFVPKGMCQLCGGASAGVCDGNGACAAPRCDDGCMDGSESYVDCGGSCNGCALGVDCNQDNDCSEGYCGDNDWCTYCDFDLECGPYLCCNGEYCSQSCP